MNINNKNKGNENTDDENKDNENKGNKGNKNKKSKNMKLCIVSNYINHHQIPLSDALYRALGEDFSFIQTQEMEEDRVKMGWGSEVGRLPYLKLFYERPEECRSLILNNDVVVFGGVEDESYIKPRLLSGKPVIRSSERLYREGQWKFISPRGLKKKYEDHTRYRKAPVYLLCNGIYVASDFSLVRAYPGKKFAWGYFPECRAYDMGQLFSKKLHTDSNGRRIVHMLFAGRFMKLKHPEYALYAAKRLEEERISYHLDMVGGGEEEQSLRLLAGKLGIEDSVTFHGFMEPSKVREMMEQADIFIFASNFLEGWGAVVNEAMNSACAVVAGAGAGAVPTLIRHGYNGYVFKNEKRAELEEYVVRLGRDDKLCRKIGENAYHTIADEWNPENAAKRLIEFCENIPEGRAEAQQSGPLSIAPLVWPHGGYRYAHRD